MGKWTVAQTLPSTPAGAVEHRLFGRDRTPQERKYLGLRLGWIDNDFHTQQQIADLLRMSEPGISNIERKLVRDMDRLRVNEQEALRRLPESKVLAKAVDQIKQTLAGLEALRGAEPPRKLSLTIGT